MTSLITLSRRSNSVSAVASSKPVRSPIWRSWASSVVSSSNSVDGIPSDASNSSASRSAAVNPASGTATRYMVTSISISTSVSAASGRASAIGLSASFRTSRLTKPRSGVISVIRFSSRDNSTSSLNPASASIVLIPFTPRSKVVSFVNPLRGVSVSMVLPRRSNVSSSVACSNPLRSIISLSDASNVVRLRMSA